MTRVGCNADTNYGRVRSVNVNPLRIWYESAIRYSQDDYHQYWSIMIRYKNVCIVVAKHTHIVIQRNIPLSHWSNISNS